MFKKTSEMSAKHQEHHEILLGEIVRKCIDDRTKDYTFGSDVFDTLMDMFLIPSDKIKGMSTCDEICDYITETFSGNVCAKITTELTENILESPHLFKVSVIRILVMIAIDNTYNNTDYSDTDCVTGMQIYKSN